MLFESKRAIDRSGRRDGAFFLPLSLCFFIFVSTIAAAPASSLTIDTLSGWDGSTQICCFGETNTASYGQLITADATENYLDEFTFLLDDRLNTDTVDFEAYVYAWDGSRATGSALFQSGPYTTTNNGGADGYEAFTITTGGVELVGGQQYVVFFSASNLFDGTTGTANWAYRNPSAYAGGHFVFLNHANDFSQITTANWAQRVGQDLAFVAEFSAGTPVPEPGTALLLATGLLGLGHYQRRIR